MPGYRIERDTMGEMRVPEDALYGAQTQRAVENFPLSGMRFQRAFIRDMGLIKACADKVKGEIGQLTQEVDSLIHARHRECEDTDTPEDLDAMISGQQADEADEKTIGVMVASAPQEQNAPQHRPQADAQR